MAKATSSSKKSTTVTRAPSVAPQSKAAATAPNAIREIKPSADQIRQRAYHIYVERLAKGGTGDQQTDWLRAERELSSGQR